jgi:hypothetical protein
MLHDRARNPSFAHNGAPSSLDPGNNNRAPHKSNVLLSTLNNCWV